MVTDDRFTSADLVPFIAFGMAGIATAFLGGLWSTESASVIADVKYSGLFWPEFGRLMLFLSPLPLGLLAAATRTLRALPWISLARLSALLAFAVLLSGTAGSFAALL